MGLPPRLQRSVVHENGTDIGCARFYGPAPTDATLATWVDVAIERPDLAHWFRGSSTGLMYSRAVQWPILG